ncbi:MAG TPA: hypothetical protein VH436_22495 [Vicinamibacterales bacterium]|jgi:hypothetical protein
MRIRFALAVCVCVLVSARAEAQFRVVEPAVGEDFHVEAGLMFWTPTPAIQLQTGSLVALGQPSVDLVGEFGIEHTRFNEFRSVIKGGRKHKLRLSHINMQYNQSATLQRTITFGGSTFPVDVPATADLKWEFWRFGYEYDFVASPRGFLGLITELKVNKVNATLAASGYGSSVTDVSAPIPAVGVIARVYPHKLFAITTEFTGFKLPGFIGKKINDTVQDDFEARMYDLDLSGTLSFARYIGAQIGYRRVTANYLIDPDAGDLKMSGMYFGGVLRF